MVSTRALIELHWEVAYPPTPEDSVQVGSGYLPAKRVIDLALKHAVKAVSITVVK